METRSASPALASQADRARRSVVVGANGPLRILVAQSARPEKRDTSSSSRQSRAERRWARLRARPRLPRKKVVKESVSGVM